MNKTKLDDLFPPEEFDCISINKDYIIISNNKRECIRIEATLDNLTRLNKEISIAISQLYNDV
tara:strand:- start:4333 stop:4521 length:189 start_codon:yes stop_codon:yes gene_type:complete